jgi:hypothetical protein
MSVNTDPDCATVQTPTGPVVIRGNIYVKWRALQHEMTPDGDDVQAHLGPPLGQETRVPEKQGGGAAQLFDRGMIVERGDGRLFVIYGAIYDHYLVMGGTASAIGPPTSDEEQGGHGARVAHFEHGDIYWRQDFGARDVRGRRREQCAAGADPFIRSLAGRGAALARAALRAVTRLVTRRPAP